jgi:hypothetical protein
MTFKRKTMDDADSGSGEEPGHATGRKVSRIQDSSKTILLIEEREPSQSEISLTLTHGQINNICNHSDYLREVITLASSDEASSILLKEKDVNLAAQFLIKLTQLNGSDSLPNLSYNLGFADLASKWIVGVYVSYFQDFIKSSLIELCDPNRQPVIVSSKKTLFGGEIRPASFVPVPSAFGSVYTYRSKVLSRCAKSEKWSFKLSETREYCFPAKGDTENLHKCSGEWTRVNHKSSKLIDFKLGKIGQSNESKFIDIVECIQAHDEYRHGTILAKKTLSEVVFQQSHLHTKKILTELMSRDDLVEYSSMLRE